MKLAISNIAWANEEEIKIAELLRHLGVKNIEIAPTKLWDDPTAITDEEVKKYISFWKSYDIEVVAFQSMLFSRPDLKIFESEATRHKTELYLKEFIHLAHNMGAKAMVFGSPKNRQRGDTSPQKSLALATPFFAALGKEAQKFDVQFCIEPNAEQYACDFITTAEQGIDIVQRVRTPGFSLHLDTACMTLAGDDMAASIRKAGPLLSHFHVSAPMLGDVNESTGIDHTSAAIALRDISYQGYISIEMRPQESGNLQRVKAAVEYTRKVYGL